MLLRPRILQHGRRPSPNDTDPSNIDANSRSLQSKQHRGAQQQNGVHRKSVSATRDGHNPARCLRPTKGVDRDRCQDGCRRYEGRNAISVPTGVQARTTTRLPTDGV